MKPFDVITYIWDNSIDLESVQLLWEDSRGFYAIEIVGKYGKLVIYGHSTWYYFLVYNYDNSSIDKTIGRNELKDTVLRYTGAKEGIKDG